MILLINYYNDKVQKRQEEIDNCLLNNIKHPLIEHIIVFKDKDILLPTDKKIIPINRKERPAYSDFFTVGNSYHGIKILANSDIYFDDSLAYCKMIRKNQVFALCRWNGVNGTTEFYDRRDSQDVWIWTGIMTVKCNFGLGIPGCDNAIAYKFMEAGYKVISPSKSIKAIHLHESGIRNYLGKKERVEGPYMYLKYY
jgi:hypothetical protein